MTALKQISDDDYRKSADILNLESIRLELRDLTKFAIEEKRQTIKLIKEVKTVEWEKFYFINTNIENVGHHFTYILDSNVVVGLSNYYYNRFKNPKEIERYDKLYKYLIDKDVLPGIGIRELSWDYEKNKVDKGKEKVLIDAFDGLFTNIAKGEKINRFNNKMIFNSIVENQHANELLLMSFCLFKKFSLLCKKENSNEIIFKKLIEFIISEHKMLLSYEITLITYYLLSNKNELKNLLQRILKINNKKIDDWQIYNASWDLFFLRMINSFTARSKDNEAIDNIYNVCLVTQDKALSEFGEFVLSYKQISTVKKEEITFPALEIDLNNIKEEYKELVCASIEKLDETSKSRIKFIQNNSNIIDYYSALLNKLNCE